MKGGTGVRIAAAGAATILAVLVLEGGLSLTLGRSLADLIRPQGSGFGGVEIDTARTLAAAQLPGAFRVHDDPRIGYTFRANTEFEFKNVTMTTDELGITQRSTPEPDGDVFRIVVLGDSVAVGQGLEVAARPAEQLERLLQDCRAPDGRKIACRAVAVPSWNAHNAFAFVIAHYDQLQPDHVAFVLVENDSFDSYEAYETGHRRSPLVDGLFVRENPVNLVRLANRLIAAGEKLKPAELGPGVINTGLGRESRRRLGVIADDLAHFSTFLQRRDVGLTLLPFDVNPLFVRLVALMDERDANLPISLGLEKTATEDTLKNDPHPNPSTVTAYAAWLALDLLSAGVIEGDAAAIEAAIPERLRGRRSAPWSPDRARQWLAEQTALWRGELHAKISEKTGEGARQYYGGLHRDGSMGPRFLGVLPTGDSLSVELAPLDGRPELYPLTVDVWVDGNRCGELVLEGEPTQGRFPIPSSDGPIDVDLRARNWVMIPVEGQLVPAACRLLEVSTAPQ